MVDVAADNATAQLAAFVAQTPAADLPLPVRRRLKECLLDTVANAAFAAVHAESSPAFRAGALALGLAPGDATVVGEAGGYPAFAAALLNGAFAHTLDFDDTNVFGSLHPGAPVVAAALVEAERLRASGSELLVALAVGYEVACRVGAALGPTAYDRGFHITGVAGLFGATAAAARLRGHDARLVENAFGLALSKAAASMQYLDNGSWNKRLHPGFAAHDALLALAFAEAGVVGAAAPIEGRYGLLAGYTNQPNPAALTDRLGQWWPSAATAIKPYPCCRFTHGAIEATQRLRERVGAEGREVFRAAMAGGARLRVRLSPKGFQIVGEPQANKVQPSNIVDAQFSVYFQVALAWLEGRCAWTGYERIGQPELSALCAAIDVQADPGVAVAGAVVEIDVPGTMSERVDDPLGEDSRPFEGAALDAKMDGLLHPVFGAARTNEIRRRVLALEDETDVSSLVRRLRRDASPEEVSE